VAEAQRAFAARRLVEAEQKYLQVLARNLAAIRLELNKLDEAEKNLKTALAADPADAFALSLFGLLKFRQAEYDEAIKALRRSTEIDAENPSAFNYLGLALAQKDRPKEAEEAFRKAIQLAPAFAGAHHNLAVFYGTRKPPSLGLAQWHYDKALGYGHEKNADLEKLLSGN
jgi:Flp pilus assembly protein TadD